MKIHVLPSGPIQTIGYLLTEARLGEAVLVDAPGEILSKVEPILSKEGCRLTELWLTHGHWDHTQEAAAVKRRTGARVRAHKADRELIENPAVMERFAIGMAPVEGVAVDSWLEHGDRVAALGREFEVRHVPGHCPGNILFFMPPDGSTERATGVAFVGDALFNRGIGRTDLPGGDFAMLERSIREQIYTLPGTTVVFPGHGPRTSVAAEVELNPFVSARTGS